MRAAVRRLLLRARCAGPTSTGATSAALVLLAAVPLGAWVGFYLERRRVGTMAFSRTHDLRGHVAGRVRLPDAPAARLPARRASALVAVALARPQRLSTDPAEVEGIDIVVALDVSNSMRETDLVPDRIDAAKRVIENFIAAQLVGSHRPRHLRQGGVHAVPADARHRARSRACSTDVRIGLVDGRAPPSATRSAPRSTACASRPPSRKVIVLVTDGDDNASQARSAQGGQVRPDLRRQSLHHPDRPRRRSPPRRRRARIASATWIAAAAALSGEPEAARGDRRDHRRHAVPGHRHRRAREALPGDPRGSRPLASSRRRRRTTPSSTRCWSRRRSLLVLLEILLSLTRFRRFP